MAGLLLHHRRLFPGADLHALGAAGVERTALGRRHGAGDVPLQHKLGGVFLPYLQPRHGGQQRLRIGVQRFMEEYAALRQLTDISQIHDQDTVAEVFDHA